MEPEFPESTRKPPIRPATPRPQPMPEQRLGDDAGMRMLIPVGRSLWAIAAGYLGLLSVLCLPAPLALFAGIMAIYDMKAHPDRHGMGRAIFGIIMGGIGSIMLVISLISFISSKR